MASDYSAHNVGRAGGNVLSGGVVAPRRTRAASSERRGLLRKVCDLHLLHEIAHDVLHRRGVQGGREPVADGDGPDGLLTCWPAPIR